MMPSENRGFRGPASSSNFHKVEKLILRSVTFTEYPPPFFFDGAISERSPLFIGISNDTIGCLYVCQPTTKLLQMARAEITEHKIASFDDSYLYRKKHFRARHLSNC